MQDSSTVELNNYAGEVMDELEQHAEQALETAMIHRIADEYGEMGEA